MVSLIDVERQSEQLGRKLLRSRTRSAGGPIAGPAFHAELDALLENLRQIARGGPSPGDYEHLLRIEHEWRSISAAAFGVVRGGGVRDDSTALSSPPAPAAPVPAAPAADASERLREKAFEVSKSRARGYALEQLYGAEAVRMREPALDEAILRVLPYDPGQADGDWFRARIVVGCQLLTGELRLVRDVTSDGFIHFESECWLREAKRVLAYLRWESKGGSVPGDPWADYFAVVNEFHQALDDGRLALERDEFNPIRDYVVKMYLDEAGELDLASAAVERMVHAKGERIATVLGLPEAKARELAEDYATKYYQNIIPAVLKHDQEASGVIDNLMRGIDARYGDIPVNCFEAAVALHFPRA